MQRDPDKTAAPGRISGSLARPGGFSGTLYDGGHVLQQLRDKAFAGCVSQAGGAAFAKLLRLAY